jgi:hypothetical protein
LTIGKNPLGFFFFFFVVGFSPKSGHVISSWVHVCRTVAEVLHGCWAFVVWLRLVSAIQGRRQPGKVTTELQPQKTCTTHLYTATSLHTSTHRTTPLPCHTSTPLHPYTRTSVPPHTATSVQPCTLAPLHSYTPTLLHPLHP